MIPGSARRPCCQIVARHLDWLLADPDHADQLLSDLEDAGSWQALATPEPATLTIACVCGQRVRVEPDQIMRCRTCGTWGVLSWWIEQAPVVEGPLPLRDLPGWLLVHHGMDVGVERLRTWADRGWISAVTEAGKLRRFDPVAVGVVALAKVTRRVS